MNSILLFFTLCAAVVVALLTYTAVKAGGVKGMVKHFKNSGAVGDWKRVMLIIFLVVSCLFFLSSHLKASELTSLNYAQVYAGIDYAYNGSKSPACDYSTLNSEFTQRATSNAGLTLNLMSYKDLDINGKYTHHSCVIEGDDKTYDAIGFEFVLKFDFK